MRKGINISHVNIGNMGGHDQSQMKIKFKKFEKSKSVPKDVPKSHNNDIWDVPCSCVFQKPWPQSQALPLAGSMPYFYGMVCVQDLP